MEKEVILLSILNEILLKQGKTEITDIKEFRMEKNELIKAENYPIIESKYDLIFEHYKKTPSHYRRGSSKNYIVILLKNMCKQLCIEWKYKEVDYGEIVNGEKYRKRRCTYTIK